MKKKVALAFSGGLDTTFCVKYLTNDKDLEVHSVFINSGGFTAKEEEEVRQHALDLGVVSHENIDVSSQYYQECIRYMVYGNMMRNRHYPMSVSSERTFQAMAVAGYARKNNIGILAHGSTGAGPVMRAAASVCAFSAASSGTLESPAQGKAFSGRFAC